MNKKAMRDTIIYALICTFMRVIVQMVFSSRATIRDKKGNAKATIATGKNGAVITNKKCDELESLNLFIYILYSITNVMLTIRMLKETSQ